jgi:FPC/CPF motif-containing protein YcgG
LSADARIDTPGPQHARAALAEGTGDGPLETVLDSLARSDLASASDDEIVAALELMVTHADFPCLGAKSVFRRGTVVHLVLDDMDDPAATTTLLERLATFASDVEGSPGFHSLMVTFRRPRHGSEAAFESSLFRLLQRLHDADSERWARGVGSDPRDAHFAFSVAGTAYFIVGLHPQASRVARRAPLATLVFNPHAQFEELRAEGRFDGMRTTIRRRDEQLQGFVNPMVADHGDSSEARQYSGRRLPPGWEPPLHVHPSDEQHDPRN